MGRYVKHFTKKLKQGVVSLSRAESLIQNYQIASGGLHQSEVDVSSALIRDVVEQIPIGNIDSTYTTLINSTTETTNYMPIPVGSICLGPTIDFFSFIHV